MKSGPPITHHCHVLADGTVIPDPGYEGPLTVQGPFRGSVSFSWLPARGTEPDTIIAHRTPARARATAAAAVQYTPYWNMGWIDYEILEYGTSTLITGDKLGVISLQSGNSGTGSGTPSGVNADWTELKRIYFYRYRGEIGPLTNTDPALQYDGINNSSVGGSVTVTANLVDRHYTVDGSTDPADIVETSTPQTWTVPLVSGLSLPIDYFAAAITDAQIDTFGQLDVSGTKVYDSFYMPSEWPEHHFYYNNFAFTFP